ncbi:MAG: hypothetical protein ABI417_17985 [Coleofasciculaceae cyanobacterium]|jgi:hypothetical protein
MQKNSEFDFLLERVQKIEWSISKNRKQGVEQMALNLQKLAEYSTFARNVLELA